MILSVGGTESIMLSAGGAKQQSTISCSKNVATMAVAEAKVAAATNLTSVATTTTAVMTAKATATLTVTAATRTALRVSYSQRCL
jgi:hypothetical protein